MNIQPGEKTKIAALMLVAIIAAYLFHLSFYYFLGDDAFIAFRYAEHLALGEGLTWNPGERVEGYTCFLWVLIMGAGFKVGISPEVLSNTLGILSGIVILVSFFIAFSREFPRRALFVVVPLAALVLSRSFCAWSTSGLETMFFTMLVFSSNLLLVSGVADRSKKFELSALLMTAAGLTRPEGILFGGIAGLYLFFGGLYRGRLSFKKLFVWGILFGTPIALHFLWRLNYYGDWLPNTFYAKVAGVWIEQGLTYLKTFNDDYQIIWFIPLVFVALIGQRSLLASLFAANILIYLPYLLYVGGDRFEFRFMVVILPALYWLIAEGLLKAGGLINLRYLRYAVVGVVSISLLATTLIGSTNKAARTKRNGIASINGITKYAERRTSEGKFLYQLVQEGTIPKDLVISVGGAGALPYYSKLPTVDRRGLNDRYIARLTLDKRGIIGHERDAPIEYLKKRRVVLFDLLNQMVHNKLKRKYVGTSLNHDGVNVPLKTVEIKGKYLTVGVLDEKQFNDIFDQSFLVR